LAIGAGVGGRLRLAKIRYHKVICLPTRDVRLAHSDLLLTFFMRQMKALIEAGHVTSPSHLCTHVWWKLQDLPERRSRTGTIHR